MNFLPPKFALLLAVIATASAGDPKIYQVQELDRAPQATAQARPRYPSDVTPDQTDITVDVAFVIDSSGEVVGARVRDCKVETLHNSVDFDAAAHGTDSKTHQSATAESDYPTLLNAANQFAASATQAVSRWKFSPGLKNGKPVDSVVAVTIEYVHKFALHRSISSDPIVRISGGDNGLGAHEENYNSGHPYLVGAAIPAQHLVYYPRL